MTEKQLQAAVLALCRLRGLLAYHTHDSRRSSPGFPDLVIAGHQGVMFAELKSMTGSTTAEQDKWAWTLVRAGARYRLWRPADLERDTIERELRRLA